jgi:hypothetical protein
VRKNIGMLFSGLSVLILAAVALVLVLMALGHEFAIQMGGHILLVLAIPLLAISFFGHAIRYRLGRAASAGPGSQADVDGDAGLQSPLLQGKRRLLARRLLLCVGCGMLALMVHQFAYFAYSFFFGRYETVNMGEHGFLMLVGLLDLKLLIATVAFLLASRLKHPRQPHATTQIS